MPQIWHLKLNFSGISRKDRYTPDKYLLDDSTTAKRPYLDTDKYDKYDKYDKFDGTFKKVFILFLF